jgi:hypothetical protein
MPHPIAIAGIVAIVAVGLMFLVLQLLARRPRRLSMLMRHDHAAIWPTGKSVEQCHEEHRDYLRERAKNDRHQDLD